MAYRQAPLPGRTDPRDGGIYRIADTVSRLGIPGMYQVRLHERLTGRLVRAIWSDATGSYQFDRICYRFEGYYAVALDHMGAPVNADVADLLTPEPMP